MGIPPFGSPPTPDATTTVKGKLKLAGDLGGTADLPTVPGLTSKADDSAVVHDTGDETVAGVKTFSSDPIIPDEVYGAGWNGTLEPPTKNALYDKIETLGSGGQTLYDIIVAPSGGDYTTLGDAAAAVTTGQTIFVKTGTYAESAITCTVANITIIGESNQDSIIDCQGNSLTFSGAFVTVRGIAITSTSTTGGKFRLTGANANMSNCYFLEGAATMAGPRIEMTNDRWSFCNNYINDQANTATTNSTVSFEGLGGICNSNIFRTNYYRASGCVYSGANNITISGNTFVAANNGTNYLLTTANGPATIAANHFYGAASSGGGTAIKTGATTDTVVGNTIMLVKTGVEVTGQRQTVTGNMIVRANTYGVHINEANGFNNISSNSFVQSSVTGTAGVFIGSTSSNNLVSGNLFRENTIAVQVNGTSNLNNHIASNQIYNSTTAISDGGTRTSIEGNRGTDANNEKVFKRMKNTSGGTLAVGDVVVFKSVAAGDEFTTTTSAGDSKVYGMLAESTINNAYGSVQILGKTTLLKVDGTTDIAIGDFLSTFTTAGIAKKASAAETAFAIALEAYTADNSSGVIDALLIVPRLI